jgi:hypothetical protein
MAEKTRLELAIAFADGERPNGQAFRDIFDSCLNKSSDGLSVDPADQTLVLARGIRLGNSADNAEGGLRFTAGQVQFNDGTGWQAVGGNAGGFSQIGATTAIAYATGNVGIGTFPVATPPTYRLEVNLGSNTSAAEQVRFGNAVCSNGSAAFGGFAMFAHRNQSANATYAVRQSPTGATQLNSAAGQILSLRQNDSTRLALSTTGQVIVGGQEANLTGSANQALQVAGSAFKNDGNADWAFTSDARVKEDVRDLDVGLAELRRVRPVRYRYNGRAGTQAGLERVGVLGQEIEAIFPETIEKVPASGLSADEIEDLRVFNPSALTYVLINAVKELAQRVDVLEQALALRSGAETQ